MRINKGTLIIGAIIALFTLFRYCSSQEVNTVTGETQYIGLTVDEEVVMGLQSAPQMAQEFGGLSSNMRYQALVKEVGNKLVYQSSASKTPYKYDFHLLADQRTVNAFALPGGQIFITEGLFNRFLERDEPVQLLAGVLGHEIGHVVARHSAEKMAKDQLVQGLLSSAAIGAGGDMSVAQIGQVVASNITMKFGREQELQSDDLGVRFMMEAGFDPAYLVEVMEILKAASGGVEVPEFQSTHPSPENRINQIKASIEKYKKTFGN